MIRLPAPGFFAIFAPMTIRLFSIAVLTAAHMLCHASGTASSVPSGNAADAAAAEAPDQVTAISGTGQDKEVCGNRIIRGFSGGMMVHTGYVQGCDNPYGYNPSGVPFGIGGVAKIHLGKHLRTGFEVYFSNLHVMGNGSFNKMFWTGVLCDWHWRAGRLYPYVGFTAGGGMQTSLYMFDGDKSDWEPEPAAVFHKEPFFAIDPFIGVEYAVGKTLRLTLKIDWLTAVNRNGLGKPAGPRLYFGFIFAH